MAAKQSSRSRSLSSRSSTRRAVQNDHSPHRWSHRLARLVGRRFGVRMSPNRSLNEGTLDRTPVVIKCAKSVRAPLTVSKTTLERVNEVWAVFLTETDAGEVWKISATNFKKVASFYSPRNGVPHYSIRYKRIKAQAELIGVVPEKDVANCEIP